MQKSIDLHKSSFLSIEWHSRLRPDALEVVDDNVDPKPSRSGHSLPVTFVILYINEVLAKLEPLAYFFLDHNAAERLAWSWVLLSQLISLVLLEMLLVVILVRELSSLDLVWVLLLDLDGCRVQLFVLYLFDLVVVSFSCLYSVWLILMISTLSSLYSVWLILMVATLNFLYSVFLILMVVVLSFLYSVGFIFLFTWFYEQQVKWELKRIHISGYRCNERLTSKTDGSKRLGYTGFHGDLEHLTIETRLIGESFEYVMGVCVI